MLVTDFGALIAPVFKTPQPIKSVPVTVAPIPPTAKVVSTIRVDPANTIILNGKQISSNTVLVPQAELEKKALQKSVTFVTDPLVDRAPSILDIAAGTSSIAITPTIPLMGPLKTEHDNTEAAFNKAVADAVVQLKIAADNGSAVASEAIQAAEIKDNSAQAQTTNSTNPTNSMLLPGLAIGSGLIIAFLLSR